MSRGMKGWQDAGSDINWQDYGGRWIKREARGYGSAIYWYLDFTNMLDAVGERDLGDGDSYVCEVKRLDLNDISGKDLNSALESCGNPQEELPDADWLAKHNTTLGEWLSRVTAECCFQYGFGAPMYSASGRRADSVRAEARREAESLMIDDGALESALDRPVNAIGSTAREMARGDIYSALVRGIKNKDPKAMLMGKIDQGAGYQTLGGTLEGAIEIEDALRGEEE